MRLPRIPFAAAVSMVVVSFAVPSAVAGPSIERSPAGGPAGTAAALPIDSEMLHRPQPFASDDGAASRRVAEPGFGDPHDWTGMLLVADGTAYPAVTNHSYRTDEGVAPAGGESTAAGWLAVAIAIAGTVLAMGFVMITTTRRRHHPAHRAPHPHAA